MKQTTFKLLTKIGLINNFKLLLAIIRYSSSRAFFLPAYFLELKNPDRYINYPDQHSHKIHNSCASLSHPQSKSFIS